MYKFIKNDAGRNKYFRGSVNDCVIRAFTIATKKDYKEVYNFVKSFQLLGENASGRNGVSKRKIQFIAEHFDFKFIDFDDYFLYYDDIIFDLIESKLTFILNSNKHLRAVIDSAVNDTHNKDCDFNGLWCKTNDILKFEELLNNL